MDLTGYHLKLIEVATEIINHGYGRCDISVVSMKDESIRIIINAGKSYVFFIHKEINFDKTAL
ncbi:MAG: hypothetical protein WAX79_01715 [Candidatus Omnitrophota bacterium]